MRIFFLFALSLFFSSHNLLAVTGTLQTQSSQKLPDNSTFKTLEEIKAYGKLRIGMYHDDPYFSYRDQNTERLEGFDADMARALADEIMGLSESGQERIEYIIIDSEKRLDPLKMGQADIVIAELAMTDQRKNLVDFSECYYVAGQSILVDVNSPFQSLEDLSGQTIGAIIGTVNLINIKSVLPKSRVMIFTSLKSGFQALKERRIQAFCIDDVMLIALKAHPERMLLDYRFIGNEISTENYGIAVEKGRQDLLDAINTALKTIKSDGRFQEIYDRNIGKISRVSFQPPV